MARRADNTSREHSLSGEWRPLSGVGNASGPVVRRPIAEWVSRSEALHAALIVRIDADVRFRNSKRLIAASLVAWRPLDGQGWRRAEVERY